MEQDIAKLKIGAILQSGIRDEADATEKYLDDIAHIKELNADGAGFSPEEIEEIENVYEEIIREEIRHRLQFNELFNKFIGIQPMEHD